MRGRAANREVISWPFLGHSIQLDSFRCREEAIGIQKSKDVAIQFNDAGKEPPLGTDFIGRHAHAMPEIDQVQGFIHLQTHQPIVDSQTDDVRLKGPLMILQPQPLCGVQHGDQLTSYKDHPANEIQTLGYAFDGQRRQDLFDHGQRDRMLILANAHGQCQVINGSRWGRR